MLIFNCNGIDYIVTYISKDNKHIAGFTSETVKSQYGNFNRRFKIEIFEDDGRNFVYPIGCFYKSPIVDIDLKEKSDYDSRGYLTKSNIPENFYNILIKNNYSF